MREETMREDELARRIGKRAIETADQIMKFAPDFEGKFGFSLEGTRFNASITIGKCEIDHEQ